MCFYISWFLVSLCRDKERSVCRRESSSSLFVWTFWKQCMYMYVFIKQINYRQHHHHHESSNKVTKGSRVLERSRVRERQIDETSTQPPHTHH